MAGGSSDNNTNDVFFIMVLVILMIAVMVLQHNFHFVAAAWKYLRIAEFTLVSWIPAWVPVYGSLEIREAVDFLKTTPSTDIVPDTVVAMDNHFARYFSWLPGLLLVALGVKRFRATESVTQRFNMEELLSHNLPLYPFVRDAAADHPEALDIDLDRDDPKSVRYASAMRPIEFATLSPPMGLEALAKSPKGRQYRQPIWDGKSGDVDWDLAERSFATQLGARYAGFAALSGTERRIAEMLVPRLELADRAMMGLVRRYARAHLPGLVGAKKTAGTRIDPEDLSPGRLVIFNAVKNALATALVRHRKECRIKAGAALDRQQAIDFTKKMLSDRSLKTIARSNPVKEAGRRVVAEDVMAAHGYVRPALMSLLDEARKSGVVAPVEFSWLKGEDRALWYCLHSVGRKTPFVEAGGAFAHWEIERLIGRSLNRPEVHAAIEALINSIRPQMPVAERSAA
ncbi:hypothetical protein J2T57_001265 [Natronocella acetinitrilica]|uniref:DotM C-terminal cytoplasmic domain-containing protein n=1 Tax=Natronocella acetinitrilica TaxID=414046 RepID=A0AAE3KBW1_9GAMM|nr:hypothetical protein [Natronocella acetinitrilica]MCP1674163.1 hypothetical protein [Natronocella acetinitrilica]